MNKTILRRMIDTEEEGSFKTYLRLRLLKERRTDQERKALRRSNGTNMIPLRLDTDMKDIYHQIDLEEDIQEDYERIFGDEE